MKKRDKSINARLEKLHQDYDSLLIEKSNFKPRQRARTMIVIYVLMGTLWILLSDSIVSSVFREPRILNAVQLYKGWFYVFATGIIFYYIIRQTLEMYSGMLDKGLNNYENLSQAYEELLTINEALRAEKELSNQFFVEATSIIIIFDTDERIINVNPYAEKVFGFKRSEMIGQFGYEILKSKKDITYMRKTFHEILKNESLNDNELEIKCKDGSYKTILWNNNALHDKEGKVTGLLSIGADITDRRQMEEKLEHAAYYDSLLEIPNRACLKRVVTENILSGRKFAMINLDLDNFKHINESMGHLAGDIFIETVANELKLLIREKDLLARLSVDQFAFLYFDEDHDKLENFLEDIMKRIRSPWQLNEQKVFITCSIGIAKFPENGTDFQTLLQNSDIALHTQKEHGKNGYTFFKPELFQKTLKMIEMGNELKEAVDNSEFLLYYQPQIELATGKMIGVEALIRWVHPKKGFISPAEFIPFSEKTGHIVPISEWVLKEAIKQKRLWDEKGYSPLKVSVNLSGYTFTESMVFERICQILDEMEVKPGEIEIEITETAVMMELDMAKAALQRLKERGLTIAMDDFGTGYSSLNYLQLLPIDILKIDRTFINNMVSEKEVYIYKTFVELAHAINISVVAEGVETDNQRDFLIENQCDIGQGYLFSKPVPALEIEKYLLQKNA